MKKILWLLVLSACCFSAQRIANLKVADTLIDSTLGVRAALQGVYHIKVQPSGRMVIDSLDSVAISKRADTALHTPDSVRACFKADTAKFAHDVDSAKARLVVNDSLVVPIIVSPVDSLIIKPVDGIVNICPAAGHAVLNITNGTGYMKNAFLYLNGTGSYIKWTDQLHFQPDNPVPECMLINSGGDTTVYIQYKLRVPRITNTVGGGPVIMDSVRLDSIFSTHGYNTTGNYYKNGVLWVPDSARACFKADSAKKADSARVSGMAHDCDTAKGAFYVTSLLTGADSAYFTKGIKTAGKMVNVIDSSTTCIATPIIKPPTDATTALKITKADGSTAVVTVNTTSSYLGINCTPSWNLTVTGTGVNSELALVNSHGDCVQLSNLNSVGYLTNYSAKSLIFRTNGANNRMTISSAGIITFGDTIKGTTSNMSAYSISGTDSTQRFVCIGSGTIDSISARIYVDRTPWYSGDALGDILRIKGKDGKIDHSTLPKFSMAINHHKADTVWKDTVIYKVKDSTENDSTIKKIVKTTPAYIDTGRNLGATITMLTIAVQQLSSQVDSLKAAQGETPHGMNGGASPWGLVGIAVVAVGVGAAALKKKKT